MTTYLAAYDAENERCRLALPQIVARHEQHAMPATFFIVSSILDGFEKEFRQRLDNPLFEIASHTRTHRLLAAHSRSPGTRPVPDADLAGEILASQQRLADLFERTIVGFRPPWGYGDGLRQAPRVLALLREGGYRYASSALWGPGETLPAPCRRPFSYADAGYPDLQEVPTSGWHENVLKTDTFELSSMLPAGPLPAGTVPAAKLTSPHEEVALNRRFIDLAVEEGMPHVSLVWHPWSLYAFDPAMTMLDRTFAYVRERRLPVSTFRDYVAGLAD